MKKLLLGMAAISMLASCAKNETFENPTLAGGKDLKSINFQTTTGVASRGASATLGTLETLSGGFETFAVTDIDGQTPSNLFNSHASNFYQFTRANAQQWDWVDATSKEWPTQNAKYPIQFFAAYPKPASLAWNSTTFDFTPAAAVKDQIDQLAATVSVTARPITGTAPLDFKHILSAIKFKLMSTAKYKINIKDLQIINVTEKNAFDYAKGTWGTFTANQVVSYTYFNSTNANSKQSFTFAAPTAVAQEIKSGSFADVAIADAGQLMLVPQSGVAMNLVNFKTAAENWVRSNIDPTKRDPWPTTAATTALASGAYIQLTYNMTDGTVKTGTQDENYIVGAAGNYVTVIFPLDLSSTAAWEMGKRYTYTLFLGTPDSSNGTLLDPDYEDETGGDTNTPVDNPVVDPGNPITKGKITFLVTVDPWTDAQGVDIK